jgi:hypothetical protein
MPEAQATAHATAHHRNIKASRAMVATEQWLVEEDRRGALAVMAEARHHGKRQ